jgi:hypothetical protein
VTRENPVFEQDVSGSEVFLDGDESRGGEPQGAVHPGGPRFPVDAGSEEGGEALTDGEDHEGEVWGTVTLTKRLYTQDPGAKAGEGDGRSDDDELKYEEEGGELDDGGLPEGPDGLEDGDLFDDGQEQDDEYAYVDDQQNHGEAVDFPPWGDGGEFPFDPRVDDRYFQHSSDDEEVLDPPTDEFEPEGEDDEPLRL